MKRHRYAPEALAQAWKRDQLNDAQVAERHAAELDAGADPTRYGMTAARFRAYAQECREPAARPIPKQFSRQEF